MQPRSPRPRSLPTGWLAVVVCLLVRSAAADLQPHEVVLIYNCQDAESAEIADAYLAARPGIHAFDLDLEYTEPADPANPGEFAATKFFITPASYERDVRRRLIEFVHTQAPDALCFVTTRGVPVLIAENFDPGVGHIGENGVHASVESALMKLGLEGAEPGVRLNPYRGVVNTTFRAFADANCLRRAMFLASRLDAAPGAGTTALAETLALINRSANLKVNMAATTIVVDDAPGGCDLFLNHRAAAQYLRDRYWAVWVDTTLQFMHGADLITADTGQCPCPDDCEMLSAEDAYNRWPQLSHSSLGRNHAIFCNSGDEECVASDYVSEYEAHPAGFFTSIESYNGLRLWDSSTAGHGSVLDWISHAGGSFTVAHAYGPVASDVTAADQVIMNLYEHGLSWGEAVMSSLPRVGSIHAPIGDPMATVRKMNPDVARDGDVDFDDLAAVINNINKPVMDVETFLADVNGDGMVTIDDTLEVINAFGRVLPGDTVNPIPAGNLDFTTGTDACAWYSWLDSTLLHRGDVNSDGYRDFEDLWLVENNQACDCPAFDITGDGVVDAADVAIAAQFGPSLDTNGDAAITCLDLFDIKLNYCDASCDPLLDLNGDGVVDVQDQLILSDMLVDLGGVGFFGELNYDGVGPIDCTDLAIHSENHCKGPAFGCYEAIYDLDGDLDVDCRDEWLLEWLIISFGGDLCPGLGCGECTPAQDGVPSP